MGLRVFKVFSTTPSVEGIVLRKLEKEERLLPFSFFLFFFFFWKILASELKNGSVFSRYFLLFYCMDFQSFRDYDPIWSGDPYYNNSRKPVDYD